MEKNGKEAQRLIINRRRADLTRKRRIDYLRLKNDSHSSSLNDTGAYVWPKYESLTVSSFLRASSFPSSTKRKKRDIHLFIEIPSRFSLIHQPIKTMFFFHWLASQIRKNPEDVYIDHSLIQSCDLLAESLLDYLVSELKKESGGSVKIAGALPINPAFQKLVRAIGIIRELNIKSKKTTDDENKRIEIFSKDSAVSEELITSGSSTREENTAREFVDYINKCLWRVDRELTEIAATELADYIGEILDNIREHSGHNEWRIRGYLNTEDMKCEIAIFNFGITIFDSFNNLPAESFPRMQMAPYVAKHIDVNGLTREDLVTVFALQQNVSSKNTDATTTRGQGTIDLLTFFNNIYHELQGHAEDKRKKGCHMTILSGHTHIYLKDSEILAKDEYRRQVAPLNKERTLSAPPEKSFVTNLGGYPFPGTAIGISFAMPNASTLEYDDAEEKNRF